jgi:hypothetical protein
MPQEAQEGRDGFSLAGHLSPHIDHLHLPARQVRNSDVRLFSDGMEAEVPPGPPGPVRGWAGTGAQMAISVKQPKAEALRWFQSQHCPADGEHLGVRDTEHQIGLKMRVRKRRWGARELELTMEMPWGPWAAWQPYRMWVILTLHSWPGLL